MLITRIKLPIDYLYFSFLGPVVQGFRTCFYGICCSIIPIEFFRRREKQGVFWIEPNCELVRVNAKTLSMITSLCTFRGPDIYGIFLHCRTATSTDGWDVLSPQTHALKNVTATSSATYSTFFHISSRTILGTSNETGQECERADRQKYRLVSVGKRWRFHTENERKIGTLLEKLKTTWRNNVAPFNS